MCISLKQVRIHVSFQLAFILVIRLHVFSIESSPNHNFDNSDSFFIVFYPWIQSFYGDSRALWESMSYFFHEDKDFFEDWPVYLSFSTPASFFVWAVDAGFSHSSSDFDVGVFVESVEFVQPFFEDSKLHYGVTFFSFIVGEFDGSLFPLIASDLISKDGSLLCMNASHHNCLGHAAKEFSKEKDSSDFDITGNVNKDSAKSCDKTSWVWLVTYS